MTGRVDKVVRKGPVRCGYRPSWWRDSHRCYHRGWLVLGGRCVEHFLERFRWEWTWGRLFTQLDLSNINRPYISIDDERPITYVALSYGNGNSDPVWFVEWHTRHHAVRMAEVERLRAEADA